MLFQNVEWFRKDLFWTGEKNNTTNVVLFSILPHRHELGQQDSSRVRAFSVGSRLKRPEMIRLPHILAGSLLSGCDSANSNKSSSAPLLSSSWGHNSACSSDRMEDLMEMDFTRSNKQTTSPPSSYRQSQTATDTSSYIDMSPGQPPFTSSTSAYVDMSAGNRVWNKHSINQIHIWTKHDTCLFFCRVIEITIMYLTITSITTLPITTKYIQRHWRRINRLSRLLSRSRKPKVRT